LLNRQAIIAQRLLKFQLGCDLDAAIVLTDSISSLVNGSYNNNLLLQSFSVENNVEYKLMDTQSRLMKMNLNLNKTAFLPDIAGYYQHDKNFNSKAISFTPPDIFGLSISIPIFSSGQRLARISQAKYQYQKALYSKQIAADGLKLSYEETHSAYISAIDKYKTAKENLNLANKIYTRSLVKFSQGMISSIDLTQTQNQYIQSQTSYYGSILELTSAKAKLEKLLSTAQ
jgi:outer membrane protein